jgi:hypothetical protein
MPRNFVYAPGLPGYGTRGVDGSAGLTGVSTYFSAYDGNTDSVTIKSKIIANNELFATSNKIPGYPSRTYQTGDLFIDKNARIFQVDFADPNLYKDTGIFLNTSGFFSSGPIQESSPEFERYSNSYESQKYLVDIVYSDTVGDYTTYPTSIYNNKSLYFSQIKYIDQLLAPNFADYYPFQVWTIGDSDDKNSIALARSQTENLWRFGNYDTSLGSGVRDVSLSLDFNDVYIGGTNGAGTIHGSFVGSVTTFNLDLAGWLTVGGDASFGSDVYIEGNTNIGSDVYIEGNTNIENDAYIGGDASFGSDVYIEGTLYGGSPVKVGNDLYIAGDVSIRDILYIQNGSGDLNDMYLRPGLLSFGTFSSIIRTDGENLSPTGNLDILTGSVSGTGSSGYSSGEIEIYTGNGSSTTSLSGGASGKIELRTGNAGNSGGSSQGGTSGDINFRTGIAGSGGGIGGSSGGFSFFQSDAGNSTGSSSGGNAGDYSPDYPAGYYGFRVELGDGGDGYNGGNAGGVWMLAGNAGSPTGSGSLGEAGRIVFRSGNGSNTSSQNAGEGGRSWMLAGNGGNYSGTSFYDGGLGGELVLRAGAGGETSSTTTGSLGGNGGDTLIIGGIGGENTNNIRYSGNGGKINISGGYPTTSPWVVGTGGNGGDVNIYGGDGGKSYGNGGDVSIGGGSNCVIGGNISIGGGQGSSSNGDVILRHLPNSASSAYLTGYMSGSEFRVRYHATGPSDERLKTILRPLEENILDKIKEINPFYYKWNDFALKEVFTGQEPGVNPATLGISAQELEKQFPELVKEFIADDKKSYKRIEYDKFPVILLKAINEQQSIIEKQQDQINKQQEQIDKLLELNNLK